MIQITIVKNGMKKLKITRSIDLTKPKVWVEGHCYKFNSTLVNIEEI